MRLFSARRWMACTAVMALVAALTVFASELQAQALPDPTPVPTESAGQAPEPTGELTLGAAVQAALARNPDLAAGGYELKAAEARILQARLRPNPELSVQFDNLSVAGGARGTSVMSSALTLSQVIEIGGKRALRTEVATSDRDVVGIERQALQLDVLAEVTRRFISVVTAQERLDLARSTRELAQRTLNAITTRVQAARSPEAERSRADIALTRAQVQEQQADSELRSARFALAALWGSPEPLFKQARADLFALDPAVPFESLVQKLEGFVRFTSEFRLRDAEGRLAQAQARPNVTFGVGVGQFNETRNTGVSAGFSMALPLFDRNQGNIREAQVRRTQTDAQRRAAFVRARAAVYGLYQEFVASRTRLETLRAQALPKAQQALDQTQYGYERGRFSYLELATAQQELLDVRVAVIEAAANYHSVLAEIERLTGAPLAAEPNPQELP
jgi:outer membrane protein, heavy metal efflux system